MGEAAGAGKLHLSVASCHFAGFLPSKDEARSIGEQEMLFFPKSIGMGKKTPKALTGLMPPIWWRGFMRTAMIRGVSAGWLF